MVLPNRAKSNSMQFACTPFIRILHYYLNKSPGTCALSARTINTFTGTWLILVHSTHTPTPLSSYDLAVIRSGVTIDGVNAWHLGDVVGGIMELGLQAREMHEQRWCWRHQRGTRTKERGWIGWVRREGGRSWLSVTAGEVCVGVGAICFKRSQYTN